MEWRQGDISITRQSELLCVSRSGLYYKAKGESEENELLMRRLDELYTAYPYYGVERMTACLRREGQLASPKRVRRLLRKMGLFALYPKPHLSQGDKEHKKYPYLLKDRVISRPRECYCADITYIRMHTGFVYLIAIMDWYSRYVVSWELSHTLETEFCLMALEEALRRGKPELFNTDQGVQFTSILFTERLTQEGVQISMDGKGRCFDNIFVERLWRSVKYEEVYLHQYESPMEARRRLEAYFLHYNRTRPHQALGYQTPYEVFTQEN